LILTWIISVVIARRAIVTRNRAAETDFTKMSPSRGARACVGARARS
jgi:hypothetical protein